MKDLDQHHYEYATKYLSSHGTYVLVEKQASPADDASYAETEGSSTPALPVYTYTALLDKAADLFPNFNLRAQHVEKKKQKRTHSKSPSPAGIRGNKGSKGKSSLQRTPSRKK